MAAGRARRRPTSRIGLPSRAGRPRRAQIGLRWTGGLLIVSLFYLPAFNFARSQVWTWFGAYIVYPLIALWLSWTHRGQRSVHSVDEAALPSWTAGKTSSNLTTTLTTFTLGTTSDTWGHAWTAAQLGTASFRVQVIDLANATSKTFSLDSVGVSITYQ